ncbi:MAG TPA: hypothetical protein VLC09_21405 [Polyangiaceae bacterium]|nr:hypothetical protein [Polyangiaceae bacterium]
MKLQVFASSWALGGTSSALAEISSGLYDGLEAPIPSEASWTAEVRRRLADWGAPWIAEVATGGDLAPHSSVSFAEHLDHLDRSLDRAAEAGVVLATCHAGSDSWPLDRAVEFFGLALEMSQRCPFPVSFETRRGRPTSTPWNTLALLRHLPGLELTCDFAQWCVVCERLPDDSSPLASAMARARHVRARVGYAQGPQVPDPKAPEYRNELSRHESWWWGVWKIQRDRGFPITTVTPSFGPDGYTHELPFTRLPVTSAQEVNRWMVRRLRGNFLESELTVPDAKAG